MARMLDAADCPLSGKDWAERTLAQPSLATAEKLDEPDSLLLGRDRGKRSFVHPVP